MPSREESSAKQRLIFALDYPSLEEARRGAGQVHGEVGMLKVGLELFVRHGPEAAGIAAANGLPLFLDLKLHDIPETVSRAVRNAAALGARYLTVHASGGRAMLKEAAMRAAEARAEGQSLEIVAVTVLTSLDSGDLGEQGLARNAGEHALVLARIAWEEGVRAFVCSTSEAASLRASLGSDATIITPGIRPAGTAAGDQKRVATPASAVAAGADRIVVGRPIRDAVDPAAAARAIVAELTQVLWERGAPTPPQAIDG
jgi:orotidine-5'-phosphate decarboxylase